MRRILRFPYSSRRLHLAGTRRRHRHRRAVQTHTYTDQVKHTDRSQFRSYSDVSEDKLIWVRYFWLLTLHSRHGALEQETFNWNTAKEQYQFNVYWYTGVLLRVSKGIHGLNNRQRRYAWLNNEQVNETKKYMNKIWWKPETYEMDLFDGEILNF